MSDLEKTSQELADMVVTGIGIGGVMVAVHAHPAHGWHPTVIAAPGQLIHAQQQAELVAQRLREQGFKLKAAAR
jgi:hypothetical protein